MDISKKTHYDLAVAPPSLDEALPFGRFCPHLRFNAKHIQDHLTNTSVEGIGQHKLTLFCEHCTTDYRVELLPDRVVFQVW
ncbi:uncharacterized protein BDZ99DRAFT_461563 [Mytilinidion resinicola]|uniref:Uncharacterized protein n=1 Tax=Mytilinidion resinicola TaxID=574789 RepID=A0A6A6YU04_9PEZI|nr:uncharacterized protein BDZ99DRAFT_461563 [Mytilinidion resinicola]KAF2811504.1 hypothetical protein BDZ99DRAFT_461563 [Mytilinidion resinicola]